MFRRLVTIAVCVLAVGAQNVDDKLAKILKEQRFNAGDGRNGAAFATENGHVFREESDEGGNRLGEYSYIGDDGKTYTVKYSAGKDGFRILDGSHIPAGGQDAAAFNPDFAAEEETVQEEELPIVAPPPPQRPAAPQPPPQPQQPAFIPQQPAFLPQQPVRQPQPQLQQELNPFINPNDPTHLDFRFNKHALTFAPESPLAKQQALVPECADCAGFNPFLNPHDPTHRAGFLAGHLAGHLAGVAPPQQPQPLARPAAPQPNSAPLPPRQLQPQQVPLLRRLPEEEEENRIKNFFPPGKLNLNRFETGFNFDFES